MADESSIVKKIETAFDDFRRLSHRRPFVSILVVVLILGYAVYQFRPESPSPRPDSPPVNITVQGFDLEKYEQQLREKFRLEENLRKAEAALDAAKTDKQNAAEQVARLKSELADARTRLEQAERAGGIIYSRFVSTGDPIKSATTEVVHFKDGRPRIDASAFLLELRRTRRVSESHTVLRVSSEEVLINKLDSDAFLNPVFWPKDKICRDNECGVVGQAVPGIIPLYQVEKDDETVVVWYENTLRAGIHFQHESAGATIGGTLMGSGGLVTGHEGSIAIIGAGPKGGG